MSALHAGAPAGWAPVSPCTPGCLTSAGAEVGRLRAIGRMAGMATVLAAVVVVTPLLPGTMRERWMRTGCRALLRAGGVQLTVMGAATFARRGEGVLVVANHLSWLDVVALDAVAPVRMLAKREVRDWPVIGGLARRCGAVFVDRSGLRTLPATVAAATEALRSGAAVGVFPEGTTWCGGAAGPFRRAAFQAAIDAGVAVRPVAIVLRHPDGTPARSATFVGRQSLLDSMRRVVRIRRLVCEVTLLPAIPPCPGDDRRELALRAAVAVARVTGVQHGAREVEVVPVAA